MLTVPPTCVSPVGVAQGATDAHEFFVLESGSCDVFVTRPGDITAKKVKSYGPGSAFGELALLYAAPRAATVSNICILTRTHG
jgi:CRP-like cAMP-binding protein